MKISSLKLVYFSPTGTTNNIVTSITQGLNSVISDVIDITKKDIRERTYSFNNELVIFGAPVYSGRVQVDAINFLKKCKAYKTPAIFIVLYGNRAYEDSLKELKEVGVDRGFVPIACGAFIGEHSFSSSGTLIASGRPDSADLWRAELFGKNIQNKIRNINHINEISEIVVPGNTPYKERIVLPPMEFVAISDVCTQCGTCVQTCPMGALHLDSTVTVDPEKCIYCCACIKTCPHNAREIKDGTIKNIALVLAQTCQARKEPDLFL